MAKPKKTLVYEEETTAALAVAEPGADAPAEELDDHGLLEQIFQNMMAKKPAPTYDGPAVTLPAHEFAMRTILRPTLPKDTEVTTAAINARVRAISMDIQANGATPFNLGELKAAKDSLVAHLTRVRAIADFFKKHPKLDRSDRATVQEALKAQNKRLQDIHDKAMRKLLNDTRPQRRAIASLAAMLELTRCDGRATQLFWSNVDPITTKTTKLRKEWSFKDMPKEQLIGKSRPIIESAVGKDGKPYPITFVPIADKYVYQTRGTLLVLGCDFDGLLDVEYWANIAQRGGAVALANCSTKILGPDPFTDETAAKLRSTYTSTSEAMKSLVICGNHPVIHPKTAWEDEAVTVYPSMVYAGMVYGNEHGRAELCFTVPPVNPVRDRLLGSWFKGQLICPTLRDRRGEIGGLPLALLVEVSNERLDDINVTFSSSKTAWSGGEHSCELELGVNAARAVIQHWLLMRSGCDLAKEEAEGVGRELNQIFRGLASTKFKNRPFLEASCDSTKSRIEKQVKRSVNGQIITDAKGQPVLTGQEVMVHELSVKFRKGTEHFEVHFLP